MLAGCGGGDSEADAADGIATLESSTTAIEQAAAVEPAPAEAAASDAEPAVEMTREDAQLEFSKCVRENGFDEFPDIAGGNMRQAMQESGINFQDPEFRETMDTCREVLADAGFTRPEQSPEEQAALQEQQLLFAACVRKAGYTEFPDPDFDGEGGGRRGFSPQALTEAGIDVRSPEFRETLDTCRSELGIEGGRGGAGGQGQGRTNG